MSFELTLLSGPNNSPILPNTLAGWLGWIVLFGVLAWGVYSSREEGQDWGRQKWYMLAALAVLVPLASLFFIFRLPFGNVLPPPELPVEPRSPALIIFAALPWTLAAGLLGSIPAVLLGLFSGAVLAAVDTHNFYTPLATGLMALVFTACVRQRYRTLIYELMRHPFVATIVTGVLYGFVYLVSTTLALPGSLAARLDFTLAHFWTAMLATGGELFLAGVICEIVSFIFPENWGRKTPLEPSPIESSLQVRFFYGTGPLIVLLLFTLAYADWKIAGSAARNMIRDRLSSTAQVAADSVPFFLETGQNLIQQISRNAALQKPDADLLPGQLAELMRVTPYFSQLYFFDANGNPVTGYPEKDLNRLFPSPEEQNGVQLALRGVVVQNYTLAPANGESAGQVSFIATVFGQGHVPAGAVLGRTDLATNPILQPIVKSMDDLHELGGQGAILDGSGRVLYTSQALPMMATFGSNLSDSPSFFDATGLDGTRQLVFSQPTQGQGWYILLSVPAQSAQQMGISIAEPLLILIFGMAVFIIVYLRLGLRGVTASLQTLAAEAGHIAEGQLDRSLPIHGADEVGRLRQAFEQMRASLKSRLDELNRLLVVSQGVASSLKVEDSVKPILEAALANGACAVRVILTDEAQTEDQSVEAARFGMGPKSDEFADMDERVLGLLAQREPLVLGNLTRGRGLNLPPDAPHPAALMAVRLKHENRSFGALWVGYDNPRRFSDEEMRFLSTLAGEAALAAANARLFTSAEIGRKRLEAVLRSTPDAILVTDQNNRLLLSNPAASQLPGMNGSLVRGKPISEIISDAELLRLMNDSLEKHSATEISFPNGRTYYATVSLVMVEEQPVGRVCILRDITHYKEVDELKSDFVATVSHDLRSPLKNMRGYATLLQMVGDLNEQQKTYVRRIISGVETMNRLVNNLLDLGRIEAGVELKLEMIPVVDAVERVTDQLQLQAAQRNIQLDQEFPLDENPVIEADRALLEQALTNLIENAIKFTPVGGQVRVKVQTRKSAVIFAVQDTGIGIAPLDQPRLFEKFYRGGSREAQQQRGSGLGLAIVKSVADRHGGRVWLESQLGKGSTFYLEIPYNQASR